MDIFVGVVVGLIVLMLLVIAHEFGHFIASRRNGVNVLEFGIGFPPRAVAWIKDPKTHKWRRLKKSEWDQGGMTKTVGVEKGKTSQKAVELSDYPKASDKKIFQDGLVFSINWLPIGGFCQMDGESAVDSREGTFGKANFWQKTKILFAGVAMNWLAAFVILTILAWTGMPEFLDNQFTITEDTVFEHTPVRVVSVHEDSPAAAAGFRQDDYIIKVNGESVNYGSEIMALNNANAGQDVVYVVQRNGKCANESAEKCSEIKDGVIEVELNAALNQKEADYLLGITMDSSQSFRRSTWSAPIVGAGLTLQITGETFRGLGELVWNLISGIGSQFSPNDTVRETGREAIETVGDSVTGPIGIIGVLFPSFTSAGPANLAFLAAIISISLACMNVLPIPALDGGRWALIGIFKLRKKKLTKAVEEKIVSRAFIVLIALIIIVTILDITRFFR